MEINNNDKNIQKNKSILEEENLINYIFMELDNKRVESKNEFEELQIEKKNLVYKSISLILGIFSIIFTSAYLQGIFKILILSLLYLSTSFGIIEVFEKLKEIKKIKKNCAVYEAQINLLIEKLKMSKNNLQREKENNNIMSEKELSEEISKANIEALEQKLNMYKYLIENDNEYKNYLNYKPLGNEYDHVFFTDKDIYNIKDAKKKVKKR